MSFPTISGARRLHDLWDFFIKYGAVLDDQTVVEITELLAGGSGGGRGRSTRRRRAPIQPRQSKDIFLTIKSKITQQVMVPLTAKVSSESSLNLLGKVSTNNPIIISGIITDTVHAKFIATLSDEIPVHIKSLISE